MSSFCRPGRNFMETKNPLIYKRFSDVDPAGLAPASPSDNNGMLHPYTTGPGPQSYTKIEKALFQGLFLCHSGLVRSNTDFRCVFTL